MAYQKLINEIIETWFNEIPNDVPNSADDYTLLENIIADMTELPDDDVKQMAQYIRSVI